ncbi:MAG TPA: hypothetical protein VHT97_01405 [Acidimicrobiales bacterium]|nr:hypothetical protein [Acidimicrobiales bacterium]
MLAPQRAATVWTCPECGHGSPEPRDQQAHLDAHRQLRRFLDQWQASAAADAAAERRARRRPFLYGVVLLLVVAVLATLAVRTSGNGAVTAVPTAGPAMNLPRSAPGSSATDPLATAPATATAPDTATAPSRAPVVRPVGVTSTASSAAGTGPEVKAPAPSSAAGATPAPVLVPPAGPAGGEQAAAAVATVKGCVLGVCLSVG